MLSGKCEVVYLKVVAIYLSTVCKRWSVLFSNSQELSQKKWLGVLVSVRCVCCLCIVGNAGLTVFV